MRRSRHFFILTVLAAAAAFTAGCEIPIGSPEERMFKSAKNDYERNIRKLLDSGLKPDIRDAAGWTPLMWAAMQGRTGVVIALAESGANMEFKDTNGNTALMLAANRGRAVTVKAMLKLGVNPFKKNKAGQTAADVARQSKYLGWPT